MFDKNLNKISCFKLNEYVHIGSIKEYHELNYWVNFLKMKISKIIKSKALPSFCTANTDVIYTILSYCKYYRLPCLIECTSNQVNQHGGYTQKTPKKFIDEIFKIAKILNLKKKYYFGRRSSWPFTLEK